MEYQWSINGVSLEYLWRIYGGSMEDLCSISGVSMEYLWRIYGEKKVLAWGVRELVTGLHRKLNGAAWGSVGIKVYRMRWNKSIPNALKLRANRFAALFALMVETLDPRRSIRTCVALASSDDGTSMRKTLLSCKLKCQITWDRKYEKYSLWTWMCQRAKKGNTVSRAISFTRSLS